MGVYPKRQNNLGCAKEAGKLAAKAGPQVIPTKKNCDSAWCDHVVKKYKVLPGKSWGTTTPETQRGWFSHHCSVPKEQTNVGCAGSVPPQTANVIPPPGPKDKKYDRNAGKWGGTRL